MKICPSWKKYDNTLHDALLNTEINIGVLAISNMNVNKNRRFIKYSLLAYYCSFVTSICSRLSCNVIITDIQMLQFVQQQIVFHMGGETVLWTIIRIGQNRYFFLLSELNSVHTEKWQLLAYPERHSTKIYWSVDILQRTRIFRLTAV